MQWPQNDIFLKSGPQRKTDPYSLDDFIWFEWDSSFSPEGYNVLIATKDLASPRWRVAGKLEKKFRLPPIIWGSKTPIALIHESEGRKKYIGVLNRGMTYILRPDGKLEAKGNQLYLD